MLLTLTVAHLKQTSHNATAAAVSQSSVRSSTESIADTRAVRNPTETNNHASVFRHTIVRTAQHTHTLRIPCYRDSDKPNGKHPVNQASFASFCSSICLLKLFASPTHVIIPHTHARSVHTFYTENHIHTQRSTTDNRRAFRWKNPSP